MSSETSVLVLNSKNFEWDQSAPAFVDGLSAFPGMAPTLSDDKDILASKKLASFQAVAIGSGFFRQIEFPYLQGFTVSLFHGHQTVLILVDFLEADQHIAGFAGHG